ncbi:MAG: hypothetical protein ACLFRG_13200 [Desulfococcaceae bacterium]
MKILIGATPASWWGRVSEGLSASGLVASALVDHGSALSEATLLVYSRPEYAVEAAVADGGSVEEAAEAWTRDARMILELFRRNRSRVTVVHGPTLIAFPERFTGWAREAIGLTLASPPRASEPVSGTDSLARVIAAQAVAASSELRDLAGELEACAVPFTDEPPGYEASWAEGCAELSFMRLRTQELVQRIEAVQTEKHRALDEVRERCAELEAAQKSANDRAERDGHVKELEEENELLLLQLHQVQEELESYYLEAKELRERQGQASARDQDELTGYALMLEHLYLKLLRSRTWKVLAPVREVSRLLKSLLRGKRMPRNRLPNRPAALGDEPVGGFYGKRTKR